MYIVFTVEQWLEQRVSHFLCITVIVMQCSFPGIISNCFAYRSGWIKIYICDTLRVGLGCLKMTMPISEMNVGLLNTSSSDYHLHIQFPLPFSLHICVASSLLHLAAFGSYLLSPLLIYRPDYEQHLIAFDMIHLVCESNSPILPVSFISVVSCYPASACRARRGALQKRMNRPTIRLGAGSCGPDEPSRRWVDWAHAGGARWNRPNDPCAAAMRPDIKLL